MSTLFRDMSQQPGLGFPQSLTETYKPRAVDEFVGLAKQKSILDKLIAQPRPCGLLFVGGPGTGKTTMAFAYARAIGGEIHHIPSQDCNLEELQRISAMCHRVPYDFQTGTPCKWHVVIIDEADQMSPAAQTFLLSRLDGSNACPTTIWILTANGTDRFQDRFLSRLLKLPEFNGYGAGKDVRALLSRIWKEKAGDAPEPDFSRMNTGNVREALQALEVELLSEGL
jgi:replication-associated recombination protein RarA